MKVTWEVEDIQPGRIVRSPTRAVNRNFVMTYALAPGGNTFGLVYLTDGQILVGGMKREQLAAHLNEGGYLPTDDDREIAKAADVLRGLS